MSPDAEYWASAAGRGGLSLSARVQTVSIHHLPLSVTEGPRSTWTRQRSMIEPLARWSSYSALRADQSSSGSFGFRASRVWPSDWILTLIRLLMDLRERKEIWLSALADLKPGNGVCLPFERLVSFSIVERVDEQAELFLGTDSERTELGFGW